MRGKFRGRFWVTVPTDCSGLGWGSGWSGWSLFGGGCWREGGVGGGGEGGVWWREVRAEGDSDGRRDELCDG